MELPPAFLRDLAAAVGFPGFFQGSGSGLARGRKGCLGLRIVKLMLAAAEVDGHLQRVLLLQQPKTLGHKACLCVRELFTEPVHRTHRILEELAAGDTLLVRRSKHAADSVLHRGGPQMGPEAARPLSVGG